MLTLFDPDQPGLTIKVPVKVMAVVTETLRQELAKECQENLGRIDYETEQTTNRLRRRQKARARLDDGETERKLQEEIDNCNTQRSQWRERLKEIAQLAPGALLLQGTVEAWVRVQAGMSWDQLDSGRIIIKDGVIVEAQMGSFREQEPCDE